MRRRDLVHWATFIIVALLITAGVVAYARLAIADIEAQSRHSLLLSPESKAATKLLHDKTLEL